MKILLVCVHFVFILSFFFLSRKIIVGAGQTILDYIVEATWRECMNNNYRRTTSDAMAIHTSPVILVIFKTLLNPLCHKFYPLYFPSTWDENLLSTSNLLTSLGEFISKIFLESIYCSPFLLSPPLSKISFSFSWIFVVAY